MKQSTTLPRNHNSWLAIASTFLVLPAVTFSARALDLADNTGNNFNVQNTVATTIQRGIKFKTVGVYYRIDSISMPLRHGSLTSGTVNLDLYSDQNNVPGSFVTHLGDLPVTSISSGFDLTTFSPGITVSSNTLYWIVVTVTGDGITWYGSTTTSGSGDGYLGSISLKQGSAPWQNISGTGTYIHRINASVVCSPITVSPASLPGGVVGAVYNQTNTASGATAPYTFTVTSGTLPTGLALSSAGVLSGTPSAAGSFNFTVTATDANGCTGASNYTISVTCPTITLSPTTLPAATVGAGYNQTVTASGGTGPYSFSISAGALPPGLTLSSAGSLTGVATASGSYNFTVQATDIYGCSGNRAYAVTSACPSIVLSPATLPDAAQGVAYGQTITASGGTAPYSFLVTAGSVPPGLFVSSGGVLSGSPSATGYFGFTVRCTDAFGCIATQVFHIVSSTILITGDQPGLNGTTPALAFDGDLSTYFQSSYNDWQYVQADFGETGTFYGLRRYMTTDGTNTAGSRILQGETVSWSADGVTWYDATSANSTGWQIYTNYMGPQRQAWHSVPYGWSAWLNLTTPVSARYIRFYWDGNNDALNEVQIRFGYQVSAPKLLPAPMVDGYGSDAAYAYAGQAMLSFDGTNTPVKLLHSGTNLFLLATGLPHDTLNGQAARLSLLFRPAGGMAETISPLDYRFTFGLNGSWSAYHGTSSNTFSPIIVPASDVLLSVVSNATSWDVELALSLEWLAGYARSDAVALALEAANGQPLAQWPRTADLANPVSWGRLSLEPIFPTGANAGSAYLDGRGGYLVIPYDPELNPTQLTIEAWVKIRDDGSSRGTLAGNGRGQSYCFGLGGVLEFSIGDEDDTGLGTTPLSPGWHHVAATVNQDGERALYLDGLLDTTPDDRKPEDRPPGAPEEEHGTLGSSDRVLRIGSDRNPLRPADQFHGLVHELRIWNYPRAADQIRGAALTSLTGTEPGLVGLWPFTQGLQDLVRGNDAGLMSGGSLAVDFPNVTVLPNQLNQPIVTAPPPPPDPPPSWNGSIPFVDALVTLNGWDEIFDQGAKIFLETNRAVYISSMLTTQGLFFATGVLFGGPGTNDGVTILIDRTGTGGASATSSDLRLRLNPNGTFSVATGDGLGFAGPPPAGIVVTNIGTNFLAPAEDIYNLATPWFSAEVQIPFSAMAPFQPGDNLRLAVRYDGTTLPNVRPDLGFTNAVTISGSWPGNFDELVPNTWGLVTTQPLPPAPSPGPEPLGPAPNRLLISSNHVGPQPYLVADNAYSKCSPAPPGAGPIKPSTCLFYFRCPNETIKTPFGDVPNPGKAGCLGSYDIKWPMVDKYNQPVVQAAGTVDSIKVSGEDFFLIHSSHDVEIDITLENQYQWLSLFNFKTPGLHTVIETESIGLPPNIAEPNVDVRPKKGDHITAAGRWIFDCCHDPKSEIHPVAFLEADRIEHRPLWPSGPLDEVKAVKVWLNSDPQPSGGSDYLYRFEFDGPFVFNVDLKPLTPGLRPFIRAVPWTRPAGSSVKAIAPANFTWRMLENGTTIEVTVNPPEHTGQFYGELVVGYLKLNNPTQFNPDKYGPYTITLNSIRPLAIAHDPQYSPELLADVPVTWYMAANVNGHWRQLLWNRIVWSFVSGYESPIPLNVAPIIVADDTPNFQLTVYEASTHDPKDELTTGGGIELANLPPLDQSLAELADGLPHILQTENYQLTYTVSRAGDLPNTLVDSSFWLPYFHGEANDTPYSHTKLGPIQVPGPPWTSDTYGISDPGFAFAPANDGSKMELFGPRDQDFYSFTTSDFADIYVTRTEIDPAPDALNFYWSLNLATVCGTPPDPFFVSIGGGIIVPGFGSNIFGYHGGSIVLSNNHAASWPRRYSLQINTSPHSVSPDWGEELDAQYTNNPGTGARLVILTNAPLKQPGSWTESQSRSTNALWAWQHVAGDEDYYRVVFPGVDPAGDPNGSGDPNSCAENNFGKVSLTACGMHVQFMTPVPHPSYSSTFDTVQINDLYHDFPAGGEVVVRVTNPDPSRRGLYQLEATWQNIRFYKCERREGPLCVVGDCAELERLLTQLRRLNPSQWLFNQDDPRMSSFADAVINFGDSDPLAPLTGGGGLDRVTRPVYAGTDGKFHIAIANDPGTPINARLMTADGRVVAEAQSISELSQSQFLADGRPGYGLFIDYDPNASSTFPRLGPGPGDPTTFYFLEIVPADPSSTNAILQSPIILATLPANNYLIRPTLDLPQFAPDGSFQFNITGQVGARYRVEFSGDFVNWNELLTFDAEAVTTTIQDPFAPYYPQQFYRVLVFP